MSIKDKRHPELVNLAVELAIDAHRGQTDKGGYSYILHPIAVADRCMDDYEKIVAILHDVVEDTEVLLEDLEAAGFPAEIVEAVEALTKLDGEDYLTDYIPRVKANAIARQVKIRDIEHNTNHHQINH